MAATQGYMTDLGLDDSTQTLFPNAQETVSALSRATRLNSNVNTTIRCVLETGGHRKCRDKLAVDLCSKVTDILHAMDIRKWSICDGDRIVSKRKLPATQLFVHRLPPKQQGLQCTVE